MKDWALGQSNGRWRGILAATVAWLSLLTATSSGASVAHASESARVGRVEVRLRVEPPSIIPGKPFWVAIELNHDPHWHTYWLNPGTGYATSLKWNLPPGFHASPIQWPTPEVLRVGSDVVGYGYEGNVWLLVQITPPDDLSEGDDVPLEVVADWLMCRVECVPGQAKLGTVVPAGQKAHVVATDPAWEAARLRLPRPVAEAGWQVRARAGADGKTGSLEVSGVDGVSAANPGEWYFFNADELVDYRPPQTVQVSAEGTVRLGLEFAAGVSAPGLRGVLWHRPDGSSSGRGWWVDQPWEQGGAARGQGEGAATVSTAALDSAGGDDGWAGLLAALAGAFAGGLILNLMPCVFPVLGLKVLGFVDQAGAERRRALLHAWVFAAGVLASFWALGGLLLLLRAGGSASAWGFQLQEPGFVFGLTVFFWLMALNLSGVFEIGGRLVGVGAGAISRGGLGGSFLSGVLATVVATPCSGPFLGTALTAALTVPAGQAMALFTAIAAGLALPYVVLTTWPALVRRLPRPGAWMETLRQLMAYLLHATVAWLVWILAGLLGSQELLAVLLALVGVAFAAWIYGRWTGPERSARTRRLAMAGAAAVGVLALAASWPRAATEAGSNTGEVAWVDWSEAAVEEARRAGRPVYIDFTARWCFTCQTNKAVVFSSPEVRQRFRELGVVAFKADWTRRDDVIAKALARYGRAAVPTNVVYLPGSEQPQVLPELLTPGIVLEALGRGQGQ